MTKKQAKTGISNLITKYEREENFALARTENAFQNGKAGILTQVILDLKDLKFKIGE